MRSLPWLVASVLAVGCGRRNFNVDGDVTDIDADAGRANRVFVTSTLHAGNLGGIAGADAICAARASEAGLDGTFVAYLAGTAAPRERLVGSRGWHRVDGKPVVDQVAQLAALQLYYPISTDELGTDIRQQENGVWTGLDNSGTPAGYDCDGWTSSSNVASGVYGTAQAGGSRAFDLGPAACDMPRRLYCFEVGGPRPFTPPTPSPGRLAFLSRARWQPGSGSTGSADAVCTAEARAAGRATGTFLAALPQTSPLTEARFDLTGPTWVRADGVPMVPAAELMFTAALADVHLDLAADGTHVVDTTMWSGNPTANAQYTCSNWSTSTAGNLGNIGFADATARIERFLVGEQNCAQTASLLCLEN